MRIRLACLGAALLAAAVSAPAQQAAEAKIVTESYTEAVDVSGGVYVGLMAEGEEEEEDGDQPLERKLDPVTLYVDLGSGVNGALCVSLSSIDGRYRGQALVDAATREPGELIVTYQSRYSEQLPQYSSAGELVALVTVPAVTGEDEPRCGEAVAQVLQAGWESGFEPGRFAVYVNSGRHDASIYAEYADGECGPKDCSFECEEIESGRTRVAFDQTCVVDLRPDAALRSLDIVRTRHRTLMPPISIPLER